jgi:hypothetical protein
LRPVNFAVVSVFEFHPNSYVNFELVLPPRRIESMWKIGLTSLHLVHLAKFGVIRTGSPANEKLGILHDDYLQATNTRPACRASNVVLPLQGSTSTTEYQ